VAIQLCATNATKSAGSDRRDRSSEIAWDESGAQESSPPEAAGPTSTLTFCAIAEVLASQLPIASLMKRFAEVVSDALDCRNCGLAVRTTKEESVVLNMSRREAKGQRGPWRQVSTPNENGGPVTIHVRSRGTTLVIEDFAKLSPDLFDPILAKEQIASAIVVPLKQSKIDYGSVGLYHDVPRKFSAEEVRFIENACNLLMIAVERSWLDHNLRTANRLQETVLQSMQTVYAVMRTDGQLVDINRAMEVLSGFAREEIIGRYFANLFAIASEVDNIAAVINRVDADAVMLESRMPTKHGEIRQVAWTFAPMTLPNGQRRCLATGVDITTQIAAVERAEVAQREIDKNRDVMLALRAAIDGGDIAQIRREMTEIDKRSKVDHSRSPSADGNIDRKRRSNARLEFSTTKLVAPIIDGKMPSPGDFVSVQCIDLSVGGISFLLPAAPTAPVYLVALGAGADALQLRAEVRNTRRIMHDDQFVFRVGCQFKDRVRHIPSGG